MACYDENQKEISCALWDIQHKARVAETGQVGSQYWLNVGYTGPEPTLAEKAAVSTAEYARDWIGEYARTITGPVAPAVQVIQTYPVTTPHVQEFWAAAPAAAPTQAAVIAARATVEPGPGPVQPAGGADISAIIAAWLKTQTIAAPGPGPVHEVPVSGAGGISGPAAAGFDLSAALPYLAIGGIALLLLSGKKGVLG